MQVSKEENSVWYQYEGLDRVETLMMMVEQLFGRMEEDFSVHPSLHNEQCRRLINKTNKTLSKLYREIGGWKNEESY